MELMMPSHSKVGLRLSQKEIVFLNNILNEVCHGFRVREFAVQIGMQERDALRLLGTLQVMAKQMTSEEGQSAPRDTTVVLDLSRRELVALRNAIGVVIRELGSEEFETRVGTAPGAAKAVLTELSNFIGAAGENRN